MKLSFYDPMPLKNDYLSIMYFKELRKFCVDKNIPIEDVEDLGPIKNATLLLNANYLGNGTITHLKNNNNKIISFDINDNSVFTDCVPEDEVLDIDLIFKIAGLQKTDESYEVIIDGDLNYSCKKEIYMGGNAAKYFEVLAANKVKPLPHVPWGPVVADDISWYDRNKLVLLRGSHQYLRVHLYLHLLNAGLLDSHSMFPGSMYLHQYCDGCKQAYKDHGRITYEHLTDTPCRLKKGEVGGGNWNNACLPRYLDIAKLFSEKYGPLDLGVVEKAFDGRWVNGWINNILNRYLFYADFKWIFSIYTPPRFWEAAGAGTINLAPERLKDQEQFPKIEEDVHYVAYKEDFSDLDKVRAVTREHFEFMSRNCFELYNTWIKPGKYKVSENLLQHIVDNIENVGGG